MQTNLIIIRHGLPKLQKSLLGSTDSPLSESGWQQLEKAVINLNKVDVILSSPLNRCMDFAKMYSSQQNKELIIEKGLREYCFGDWDGLSYQLLNDQFPEESDNFFRDPYNNTPPNAETLMNFSQRVEQSLLSIIKQHQGKQVVIFTHAGVIRTIIAWCFKMDYKQCLQFQRFTLDYASINQLTIFYEEGCSDKFFPQLIKLNDISHL